ncbi:MAG TPA: ATP-dependent Clp protease proteolytic subunit [Phycisphaerae bacterium]|nr:ATP-dependent Clp protease proteolytic subunit [Phycisphaerae bacterium]
MALFDSSGRQIHPIPAVSGALDAPNGDSAMIPDNWPLRPRNAMEYQRWRQMTVDEMLLENRVVFLVGEINYGSATNVIMRLLYLQSVRKDQDINLYVNSPGGAVDDTLAIYDTMKFLSCDVATFCVGQAMSGGAIVLAAGTKGKRYALPHAKVMIHQPFGGIYGQTADIAIQAEEILKTKETLTDLLSHLTGQPREKIAEDQERDKYFSAHDAKAYGLVDEVLEESDRDKKEAIARQQQVRPGS